MASSTDFLVVVATVQQSFHRADFLLQFFVVGMATNRNSGTLKSLF
jgi:hypothetical protein